MSPNPKRTLSTEDEVAIRAAMLAHEDAYAALKSAVAASTASVRSLAEFTGMSTQTIQRWKHDG
jgi:hypothetical protein